MPLSVGDLVVVCEPGRYEAEARVIERDDHPLGDSFYRVAFTGAYPAGHPAPRWVSARHLFPRRDRAPGT